MRRQRTEPSPGSRLFDLHADFSSAEDFGSYYDRPPDEDDPRPRYEAGPVTWLGEAGRMFRAEPGYASPRADNIFDPGKLAAAAEEVRSGRGFVSEAPYGTVMRIDLELVAEMQAAAAAGRLWEYGVARPFTTGDAEIDAYLADPEAAFEASTSLEGRRAWSRRMGGLARVALKRKAGDLGRYWARVRDANHRAFGSLIGGCPYFWMRVWSLPDERLPRGLLR